jgi:hypothetical protein
MDVTLIRARMKPQAVAETEAAVADVIRDLEEAQLANVRYASTMAEDGQTFVVVLGIEGENPLPQLDGYRRLLESLPDWVAEPQTVEKLTVVGSYRLF